LHLTKGSFRFVGLEGAGMCKKTSQRMVPGAWFLASVAAMAVLDYALPGVRRIPVPYRYGGIALVLLGLAMGIWAVRIFKEANTTLRHIRQTAGHHLAARRLEQGSRLGSRIERHDRG
jgi:protein-S-isoprenylcysteine O-methyltransferase Ste14